MIRLNCPACGHGLQVKEAHAGKRGRCPKCNQVVVVPTPPPSHQTAPPSEDETVTFREGEMHLKERPPDGPRPEAAPPAWTVPEPAAPTPAEPKGLRKHPWPLDVLLYPTSVSGLVNIVIFTGLLLLGGPVGGRIRVPYMGILILIGLIIILAYAVYYLTDCVRDSAGGGTRAVDNLTSTPGLIDILVQVGDVLVAILGLGLPAWAYGLVQWRIDPVFWAMVGCAGFCLPMALLSVILFDSLSGLNPRYWLISIGRAFIPYVGLVLALTSIIALMVWVGRIMERTAIGFVFSALLNLYVYMIAAHILGRFYFRYEKKIGWGI